MKSMNFARGTAAFFLALGMFCPLKSDELLKNADFSQQENGVPAGWEFRRNENNTAEYTLINGENGEPNCMRIVSADITKNGTLCQTGSGFTYPAGSKITLSGEYRTENVELGAGPQHLLTSLLMRHRNGNTQQPQVWLAPEYKPASSWTKFTDSRRLPVSIEFFGIYPTFIKAKGSIYYRNLSVKADKPTTTPDPKAEYIWREAEDLVQENFTDIGRDTEGYFSGRGGAEFTACKLLWKVDIAPGQNSRTWHVWGRIYGYRDNPRIFFRHNDKYLGYVDTPANERSDKPGRYVWAYFGCFNAAGGMQTLTFRTEKKMMFDALLLTTDATYAPQTFEAKDMPQAKFTDSGIVSAQ